MEQFKSKFPAFTALLLFIAVLGKELSEDESLLEKIKDSVVLVPQAFALIPQLARVDDEAKLIAADPQEVVFAAELLVTECGFSSTKAQDIIKLAFPYAEKVASLIPETKALIAAVKA